MREGVDCGGQDHGADVIGRILNGRIVVKVRRKIFYGLVYYSRELRLASVIGSVFLGAVTSLLRTLECRVGSASSERGWLARRLEGRSKGVRRERVRKLDGSMRRSDEVKGEMDDLEMEMEMEMEMERWMVDGENEEDEKKLKRSSASGGESLESGGGLGGANAGYGGAEVYDELNN
ncbi:hypothetical protein EMCG_01981 [[Emmonsia] crescens]|uniref:Uncharacterized protein n=1 Tax=[Emmonsia] crescens TaxID=73230 RepID=A0A0G2J202_9EURO|nr:hypothetical protein EMCG_01981 [Emmonsia crescens UAMH 3008]